MSASRPRGLCVYEPTGRGTEARLLGSGETRHRHARSAYSLSLFILSTRQGKAALIELSRRIITGLRSRRLDCRYPRDDKRLENLGYWVGVFLDKMNNDPPEVYLTATPGEALTRRYLGTDIRSTLEAFMPCKAGHLEMNAMIMADMARAPTMQHSVYMFQMAIAVAHEIGHFLTSFLSGAERAETPETASIPGAPAEAGFFWERGALQGIVEFYADPRAPDKVNQPGIAYIFPDARDRSMGRMVSIAYIEKFVSGPFGFQLPIETDPDQPMYTRAELDRMCNRMSKLRKKAAEGQSRLASGASEADRAITRDRYGQRQHYPSQMQQFPNYPSPMQQYPNYPSQMQQYPPNYSNQMQQYPDRSRQQYSQQYYPRQDYYGGPSY